MDAGVSNSVAASTERRSSLCLSKFIVRAVRTNPEPNEGQPRTPLPALDSEAQSVLTGMAPFS
jgi:hypothetical protein